MGQQTAGHPDPARIHGLLSEAGFPLARQAVAPSAEAACDRASELGYPVALKAFGPGLLHRAEAQAVKLDLTSADQVGDAAREMQAHVGAIDGFLVQEMGPRGLEMVVGFRRDPSFGPLVMAGIGGALVEAIGDVATRLAPVSGEEAEAMLAELRLSRSASLRARFAVELSRLRELIVLVSRFAQNHPEIAEMDLNPVILTPGRTVIVDAKLLLGATPQTSRGRRVEGSSAAVRRMLEAKSIAVVGASADRRKQGGRMFGYLVDRGFAGNLYPVNTHEKSIAGHRCFPTVDALPEAPDLACIAVPADGVAAVVEACGRRGVQAVAVFTSGFGETGEEGRRREQALVELARRYGMRVCGPNTAGFMNESTGVCATISMAFEAGRMPRGNVAMISQSGALGGALLSRAWDQGIGLATWICTGNEADLTLGDYMQAMVAEPRCAALVVFMETIRDPRSFTDACSAAQEAGKPVVVYRSGTSAAGRQAMQTHTGAIAGDDAVLDAVFGKHGVIRVRDLQSLLDLTSVLERTPLPSGNRVAVVSASGGACGIVADECERRGLRLANLSAEATAAIAKVIPPFGVPSNPIDMTMEITVRPDMAGKVVSVVLAESGVDAVLVVLTTNADPPALEVARGVINAANTSSKPVLVARLGADSLAPRAISLYRQSGMPVFPMPERAVATLRGLYDAGCAR